MTNYKIEIATFTNRWEIKYWDGQIPARKTRALLFNNLNEAKSIFEKVAKKIFFTNYNGLNLIVKLIDENDKTISSRFYK